MVWLAGFGSQSWRLPDNVRWHTFVRGQSTHNLVVIHTLIEGQCCAVVLLVPGCAWTLTLPQVKHVKHVTHAVSSFTESSTTFSSVYFPTSMRVRPTRKSRHTNWWRASSSASCFSLMSRLRVAIVARERQEGLHQTLPSSSSASAQSTQCTSPRRRRALNAWPHPPTLACHCTCWARSILWRRCAGRTACQREAGARLGSVHVFPVATSRVRCERKLGRRRRSKRERRQFEGSTEVAGGRNHPANKPWNVSKF